MRSDYLTFKLLTYVYIHISPISIFMISVGLAGQLNVYATIAYACK